MVEQMCRVLRKGNHGWVAYVSNEVRPRRFPITHTIEDCLFDLEMAGFNVDRVRARMSRRREQGVVSVENK